MTDHELEAAALDLAHSAMMLAAKLSEDSPGISLHRREFQDRQADWLHGFAHAVSGLGARKDHGPYGAGWRAWRDSLHSA